MELCVLAHPRVAVVHVGGRDVLVGDVRQYNEPLLEKLGSESETNFRLSALQFFSTNPQKRLN